MTTATVHETKTVNKLKEVKMWQVMLLNDDYTPFHFVAEVLTTMFNKDQATAEQIALNVHRQGSGVAGGPYTREIAEQKAHDVIFVSRSAGHPLVARPVELD